MIHEFFVDFLQTLRPTYFWNCIFRKFGCFQRLGTHTWVGWGGFGRRHNCLLELEVVVVIKLTDYLVHSVNLCLSFIQAFGQLNRVKLSVLGLLLEVCQQLILHNVHWLFVLLWILAQVLNHALDFCLVLCWFDALSFSSTQLAVFRNCADKLELFSNNILRMLYHMNVLARQYLFTFCGQIFKFLKHDIRAIVDVTTWNLWVFQFELATSGFHH